MDLVKQLDRNGCSLACTAMIAGTSYEDIKKNIYRKTSHNIKKYLNSEFNIKSRFIKFNKLKDLKNDCMLIVVRMDSDIGEGSSCHAVVYDSNKKEILDPDTSNIKDLSNYNIVQCLEIIKEKRNVV
jgi:ABC-type bacteriocin/lantibiotic exporter with double-glycine peptidase domain